MTTVKLKSLRLRSFRSFVGESVVEDFPDSGLVLVRGVNRDTGGSSGSGKSSLLLAIARALRYAPYPSTQLQSWLTEDPLQIQLELETERGVFTLSEGTRSRLEGPDGVTTGSKPVAEALERLLGVPPDILGALTYRAQRTRSKFLSMSDSDKKEFLSSVLGLDRFESAAEHAKSEAKRLTALTSVLEQSVEVLRKDLERFTIEEPVYRDEAGPQAEKASLEAQLVTLEKSKAQVEELLVRVNARVEKRTMEVRAEWEGKLAALDQEIVAVGAEELPTFDEEPLRKQRALLDQCLSRLNAALEKDNVRRQQREQELRFLERDLTRTGAVAARKGQVVAALEAVRAKLKAISEERCPTCEQHWATADSSAFEAEAKSLEQELASCEEAAAKHHDLDMRIMDYPDFEPDPMIAKLESVRDAVRDQVALEEQKIRAHETAFVHRRSQRLAALREQRAQLQLQLQGAVAEATEKLVTARAEAEARLVAVNQQLAEVRQAIAEAGWRLNEAKQVNALQRENYERRLGEREELRKRLEQEEAALEKHRAAQRLESDLAALLGREGFLGAIFDEVLEEIADETNAILASVPNVAHVSFSFRSESSTQKGTIKRSIIPVVSIAGHEAPMESGLSGGMYAAAELAVDLAFMEVVSRRKGVSPGWLVLDEAFVGLGIVEKEACLEVLSRFARNKLVLVVDHDNQFKEMFAATVTVEHSNGVSTIVQ